jgi:hypothetical protein
MAVESSVRACSAWPVTTQGAEAGVAMGLEGTHAECRGQSEGLPVVGFGQGHIWRLAVQCDCTEEP